MSYYWNIVIEISSWNIACKTYPEFTLSQTIANSYQFLPPQFPNINFSLIESRILRLNKAIIFWNNNAHNWYRLSTPVNAWIFVFNCSWNALFTWWKFWIAKNLILCCLYDQILRQILNKQSFKFCMDKCMLKVSNFETEKTNTENDLLNMRCRMFEGSIYFLYC